MAKVTPTTAPDFTEDERKWIEQHPVWRVIFMILRLALVPAMIAGISAYFEYKSSHNDQKTEAAYKAVAPAVDATQEQVKQLTKQVELLQALVVTMVQNGNGRSVEAPSGSIGLGSVGTLGYGAGSGSGQGYGSGAGHLGGGASEAPAAPAVDPRLRPLTELQASARERRDVVALNCITEKLRLAKQAVRARQYEEVASLTREARQCVGQAVMATPTVAAAPPKPSTKASLIDALQSAKPTHYDVKPLPKSANDALQQMAK